MGICQSHCPEHSWKRSKYQPGKKSIFAEDQKNETEDQDAEQEAEEIDSQANDDDDEEKVSGSLSVDSGSRKDSRRQSKAATTSQYTQRNFHNLDECVSWLLSKINVDLETEFSDTSNNSAGELELGSPQWIEAASSNNQDKTEQIVENPFANQRTVESLRSTELERNCQCPQCCHIELNCVHQDSYNSTQDKDEDKFGSLEDSKELTSSLECFDFVYSDMNTSEVVSINQCPNNSNGSGRSQSRRSVSPSKAAKNGKGEF